MELRSGACRPGRYADAGACAGAGAYAGECPRVATGACCLATSAPGR